MKVHPSTTTPDAYKQQQYYAGTHLAYYPIPTAGRYQARVKTEVEYGIFTRYLEKENGQRDMLTTSSTKEKMFLEKRIQHAEREELMQRLNYNNGVHYSVNSKLYIEKNT